MSNLLAGRTCWAKLQHHAAEQLLHQLALLLRLFQMESCNTNMDSEYKLGRLGLQARTGLEARFLGAGDQPALRRRFLSNSMKFD